jgi:hypothetical protein
VVKRKLLKIELELVLPSDLDTPDVLNQLQKFLMDEIDICDTDFVHGPDSFEWMPFDCGAITMTLLEEHPNVGIDIDDDIDSEPHVPFRELKKGSA